MKTKAHKLKTVLIITLVNLLISSSVFAQTSFDRISYQAVIRDADDNLVTNQTIGIQISIWQAAYVKYKETHTPTTNANGLISIQIGGGTVVLGTFANIDWKFDYTWLKTEIDPTGGTNYTITDDRQFLSTPFALHSKTAETAENVLAYSVGDFAMGGIVFWVDERGQHGLVCAKSDQNSGVRWFAGTNTYTMARGDGPYSGKLNTAIIIANQGNGDGGTYAARICNELQITEGDKTYGDWYLPSKGELYLMYLNKSTIDATATANGGVAFFTNENYSSSTEGDNSNYWAKPFNSITQFLCPKNGTTKVRAVRSF